MMAFVGLWGFTDSLWMFPGQNKNVTKMWQLSHRLYTVWKGCCHILNTFLFPVSFLLHFWTILSVFCHNLVFESLIICLLSSYNLLSHFCQIFVNFCYIFVTFWKLRDLNWSPVPNFLQKWTNEVGGTKWPFEKIVESLWIELYERGFIEADDVTNMQLWLIALSEVGHKFFR